MKGRPGIAGHLAENRQRGAQRGNGREGQVSLCESCFLLAPYRAW